MLNLKRLHHVAIICSDYAKSKQFYTEKLGLEIVQEVYRSDRKSFKLDLAINRYYQIELFSFPDAPPRLSFPEAQGLRHLAFEVDNLDEALFELNNRGILTEEIRTDEYTNKRFVFFKDPDELPIELYES
jgi:glyoxylase I family protein